MHALAAPIPHDGNRIWWVSDRERAINEKRAIHPNKKMRKPLPFGRFVFHGLNLTGRSKSRAGIAYSIITLPMIRQKNGEGRPVAHARKTAA